MNSAETGDSSSQDHDGPSLDIIALALQPHVDAFLETIYKSSTSLLSNAIPTLKAVDELMIYAAIEVDVRRLRNRRAIINQLPVDIIHHIFSETLDLERIHDVDFPLESIAAHRKQLFQLRGVSYSWNNFLLSSSRYWSAIDLGTSPAIIDRTLQRAQHAHLCLYTSGLTYQETRNACGPERRPVIESRRSQIRSLRSGHAAVSKFLESFFGSGLANVRTVDLCHARNWGRTDILPIPNVIDTLQHIRAVEWCPDLSGSQLANLQSLVLCGGHDLSSPKIRLIAACTNLLLLSLEKCEPRNWGSGSPDIPSTITLHHLQELHLDFTRPLNFGALVRMLAVPSEARGTLKFRSLDQLPLDGQAVDHLLHFILPSPTAVPSLNDAMIKIQIAPRSIYSPESTVTYSTSRRSINLPVPRSAQQAKEFGEAIKAFQDRLKGPHLTISLVNYSSKDYLLHHLTEAAPNKVWIKSSEWVGDALTAIGTYDAILPSGTTKTTTWPFESLQELIVEDCQINVKQLTRIVGIRRNYLRTGSLTWLKRISLVNCHLIGMPFEMAERNLETWESFLRKPIVLTLGIDRMRSMYCISLRVLNSEPK